MNKQHQFKITPGLAVLLLILASMGMVSPSLFAQANAPITDDGQIYTYAYSRAKGEQYTIIKIPANPNSKYLYLEVKGANGGRSHDHEGGIGATARAYFEIGTGDGQIKPGSQIRLFPSNVGDYYQSYSGSDKSGAGGGGASAAVIHWSPDYDQVYPDNQFDDHSWQKSLILLVAGGGGGGGEQTAGLPGQTSNRGAAGQNRNGQGLYNGGEAGKAGGSGYLTSGGASYIEAAAPADAIYDYNCKDGLVSTAKPGFQSGLPTGGKGAVCILNGGWGFAGGGEGNRSGGGGGGYSGGGAGISGGGGGGGGSYITDHYTPHQASITVEDPGNTGSQELGYVKYGLVDMGTIKLAANRAHCIDNSGGGLNNGNNIQLWTCQENNNNQVWTFSNFQIKLATHLDKCLNLDRGIKSNGANIQLNTCYNSGLYQTWMYDGISKQIRYMDQPDKCLDLVNGNTANSTNIQLYDCVYTNYQVNQQWEVPLGNAIKIDDKVTDRKTGSISPIAAESKCVSLQGYSVSNNTNIQLEACKGPYGTYGDRDQAWYFDGMQIKLNKTQNDSPSKCLDLDGSNTSNGRNIQLFDCNGTDAQKWFYDGQTNQFRSKIDHHKCLDISNGAAHGFSSGRNVQLWDCMPGNPNQQFVVKNI